MFARKPSTSTESESDSDESGSTSDSSDESGSSSSDSGTSSSSEDKPNEAQRQPPTKNTRRPSVNSQQHQPQQQQQTQLQQEQKTNTIQQKAPTLTPAQRRKSLDARLMQQQLEKPKEPPPKLTSKQPAAPINRSLRLSKSSVYSSDDESSPLKKTQSKFTTVAERKKPIPIITANIDASKKIQGPAGPQIPTLGGKAPPSVVKQHQQQQQAQQQALSKSTKNPSAKIAVVAKKAIAQKSKEKSVFSPDESSSGSEKEVKELLPKPKPRPQITVPTLKPEPAVGKRKASVKKSQPIKKSNESKSSDSSSGSSGSSDDTGTGSDTGTGTESDSSNDSASPTAPVTKRQAPVLRNKQPPTSSSSSKIDQTSATGKDNSGPQSDQEKSTTRRKLTRSSSTRKSKHLIGKSAQASDSDSDTTVINKSRSISKSPVKKASTNSTKSSSKVGKRAFDSKPINQFVREFSPVPDVQKCSVENCDATGHLNGIIDHHFLTDACPIFHNMTAEECKERAIKRKQKEQDQAKRFAEALEQQKHQSHATPEQKIYYQKIREARAQFKLPIRVGTPILNPNEKSHKHKHLDQSKEPNLIGLVPEHDLELFREAQALASEKIEKELKDSPVGCGIKYITMGKYQMKVWYQSPYPEDVARIPKMYICEFCLRYQKSAVSMKRHSAKCVWRHPPGDEIYRKGKLQVWQVDGKRFKLYCQHLCLLAKFFLDHKTLYHDVEPFLFYVMTLADSEGCHTVGYFSKEKNSFNNYNVSCILTLPPYQRKGYGRLLIDFSYLLTSVEGKIGSPEKPLSDLGLISYRSYWKDVLLDFLCTRTGSTLSIKDLSQEMAIYSYDIVSTLQALGMMKYWKGKHIVLKKQDILEEYEERVRKRGDFPKIDPNCLRWNPYIPPQTGNT